MILRLQEALEASWGPDTAQPHDGEWSSENPAKGQCAVSAMVVQHFLGGEIVRGVTNTDIVHYWNQLGHAWYDSTRSQFRPDEQIVEYIIRPDDYLYKFEDTVKRFDTLLARVVDYFAHSFYG